MLVEGVGFFSVFRIYVGFKRILVYGSISFGFRVDEVINFFRFFVIYGLVGFDR